MTAPIISSQATWGLSEYKVILGSYEMLMSPLLPQSQDSLGAGTQENGGKKRKQQNMAFLRSVFPVSQEGFSLSSLRADATSGILSYV